ncbi:MAG: hypothetical protein J3K34DRAFT_475300 [Monoraphidium minutum]|nr:MAG: hypothetical protein J3K34DRAFT_475300 [Monoraphidium minutum]
MDVMTGHPASPGQRAVASAAPLLLLLLLGLRAAEAQCPPGTASTARGCVRCAGNKVSQDGWKCVKCPKRTVADADKVLCECAAGVEDDGVCGSCLPGYGGSACKRCSGTRKYSRGGSLAACRSCPRRTFAAPGATGCDCSGLGLVWDPASLLCASGDRTPACGAGQELFNGRCVAKCKDGESRNQVTGACEAASTTPEIPAGGNSFKVDLVRIGNDGSQDATFAKAKARWESILSGVDQPTFRNRNNVDLSMGQFPGYSNRQASVDDIVLMYSMQPLEGNILGFAGPTYFRDDGSPYWHTPGAGVMAFSAFEAVVLHEMGHALGLGTIDQNIACVRDCVPGSRAQVFWQCANANREYAAIGCTGPVPIETTMGEGSGCAHWSEALLVNELMTPSLNLPYSPISRVTLGALEDLYGAGLINYGEAEAYTCRSAAAPNAAAAGNGTAPGAAPEPAAGPAPGGSGGGEGGAPAGGYDVIAIRPLPINGGSGSLPPTPEARAAIDAALARHRPSRPGRPPAAAAAPLLLLLLLGLRAAAAQCSFGYANTRRGCVRCSTGNKIVSADGRKCVKCPRRTIPREASAVVCVCAAGVADDGSCGSCLPGFGGSACKRCSGTRRFSRGGSLAGCKSCPRGAAAAPGNAGCVCSAAGQVWDAATNKCVPGVVPPDPSGPGAGKFNIQLVNMGTDASQDAAYQARRGPFVDDIGMRTLLLHKRTATLPRIYFGSRPWPP